MYCPGCTQPLEAPDLAGRQVACPFCGTQFVMPGSQPPAPPVISTSVATSLSRAVRHSRRPHGMAAFLSFLFPGLGQLLLGEPLKAICFILAACVFAVLAAFVAWPIVALSLLVWVWAIFDAAVN